MDVILYVVLFGFGVFVGLIAAESVAALRGMKDEAPSPRPTSSRTPKPSALGTLVSPNAILFRCPKCGRCAGRRGPYLTKHALHGHMRACPGEWI